MKSPLAKATSYRRFESSYANMSNFHLLAFPKGAIERDFMRLQGVT